MKSKKFIVGYGTYKGADETFEVKPESFQSYYIMEGTSENDLIHLTRIRLSKIYPNRITLTDGEQMRLSLMNTNSGETDENSLKNRNTIRDDMKFILERIEEFKTVEHDMYKSEIIKFNDDGFKTICILGFFTVKNA